MQSLIVRYYFTNDTEQIVNFNVDNADYIGINSVLCTFFDQYAQFSFTSDAGNLLPGCNTGEIRVRFTSQDALNFNQADDYSFDASYTSFADYMPMTIYRYGDLIWGSEGYGAPSPSTPTPYVEPTPTPTPTPVPQSVTGDIKIDYKPGSQVASIESIRPLFILYNNTANDVTLSEIKIRYYFIKEGGSGMMHSLDYAPKYTIDQFLITYAERYLEIGFKEEAGILAAGTNTEEIQLRFYKQDWSIFDQSNDYSFDISLSTFTEYMKMTIYRNNVLIWGSEEGYGG